MTTLSPIPPGRMTAAEFLDWAAREDVGRVELIDGEVVAMASETRGHGRVKKRIDRAFDAAIAECGILCESYVDSIGVEISESDFFIPDVVVDCGDTSDMSDRDADRPTVVVEVLSPSTWRHDTNDKLLGYFSVDTVMHYLIVNMAKRVVVHHARNGPKIDTTIKGSGPLDLTPPGIAVDIEDFWSGLPPKDAVA